MQEQNAVAKQLANSILAAAFLRIFVRLTALWCCAWGTAVLAARMAFRIDPVACAFGAIGLLPIWLVAVILSRQHRPSVDQIRAKLDAASLGGGMIMTEKACEQSAWHERAPTPHHLVARWHDRRSILACAAGCLYVAASFMMPHLESQGSGCDPLLVEELVDDLQADIQLLAEEEIVDDERAELLTRKLEEVVSDASVDDAVKTWEALDHIAENVDTLAKEATEALSAMVEEAATLEALAGALEDALTDPAMAARLTEAMKEFAALMKTKELLDSFEGALTPELAEAIRNLSLDPQQLEQLAQCMAACKGEMLAKMGRLCDAQLADPAALELCQAVAADAEDALLAFLEDNAGSGDLAGLMALCMAPGTGGINRGRGDAPLTWTDGSDENGVGFKEKMIQPAGLGAVEESKLIGVSLGSPETPDGGSIASGGALATASAGAGEAHKHRILPQHQQVVMQYFSRGDKDHGRNTE